MRRLHLRRYGMSVTEYETMYAAQNGCCAICSINETLAPKKRLCVDHDHKTGDVRALLCVNCNTALGMLQDDPSLFVKATQYLQKHASNV